MPESESELEIQESDLPKSARAGEPPPRLWKVDPDGSEDDIDGRPILKSPGKNATNVRGRHPRIQEHFDAC